MDILSQTVPSTAIPFSLFSLSLICSFNSLTGRAFPNRLHPSPLPPSANPPLFLLLLFANPFPPTPIELTSFLLPQTSLHQPPSSPLPLSAPLPNTSPILLSFPLLSLSLSLHFFFVSSLSFHTHTFFSKLNLSSSPLPSFFRAHCLSRWWSPPRSPLQQPRRRSPSLRLPRLLSHLPRSLSLDEQQLDVDSGIWVLEEAIAGARKENVKEREELRSDKDERSCVEKDVRYT